MPEKEARPPAQNRHGGAPRGERVPPDARRASPGTAVAPEARQRTLRLSALRPPLEGGRNEDEPTRAQERAAATKEAVGVERDCVGEDCETRDAACRIRRSASS